MTSPSLVDLQDESTWLEWRSRIPAASVVTEMVSTSATRAEFLEGARLLRMDVRRRGGDGEPGPSPIQLVIADVLNAGRKFNGVLEPRRSTKTTAIQAVTLGRCTLREDYVVGWTLAKRDGGTKTSERFRKDIVSHVERLYPDPKTRPFTVNTSNGHEHIRWPNGSWFNVYAPQNEAFTSGGFDIAWVDEAQDASPDLGEDLMTSIPPTLDGRFSYTTDGLQFGGQMIGSGTAPDYQGGNLLWKLLTMDGAGVVRHGAPLDTEPEEIEAWEPDSDHPDAHVRELIELHHPGIGYTTPLSDVLDNFNAMSRDAFSREYLSLPGEEGSKTALIPAPQWESARRPLADAAEAPRGVKALAFAVHPDARWVSVAMAWKVGETRHVVLLHHLDGVDGLPRKLRDYALKHRRQIVFDGKSAPAVVELSQIQKPGSPVKTRPLTTSDISRATVLMLKLLKAGQLVHYSQAQADAAAEIAIKRRMGDSGAYAFGRPDVRNSPDDDITPVEAMSMALYALEDEKAQKKRVDITGV